MEKILIIPMNDIGKPKNTQEFFKGVENSVRETFEKDGTVPFLLLTYSENREAKIFNVSEVMKNQHTHELFHNKIMPQIFRDLKTTAYVFVSLSKIEVFGQDHKGHIEEITVQFTENDDDKEISGIFILKETKKSCDQTILFVRDGKITNEINTKGQSLSENFKDLLFDTTTQN